MMRLCCSRVSFTLDTPEGRKNGKKSGILGPRSNIIGPQGRGKHTIGEAGGGMDHKPSYSVLDSPSGTVRQSARQASAATHIQLA